MVNAPPDPAAIERVEASAKALRAVAQSLRTQVSNGTEIAGQLDNVITNALGVADGARRATAFARKLIAEDAKVQIEAQIAGYDAESRR